MKLKLTAHEAGLVYVSLREMQKTIWLEPMDKEIIETLCKKINQEYGDDEKDEINFNNVSFVPNKGGFS